MDNDTYSLDEAMRQKMDASAGQCATEPASLAGILCSSKPALRERLQAQLGRSRRAAHKAGNIDELLYLLDKHPDVARILELVELIGQ